MKIVIHAARHTWRWSLRLAALGVLLLLLVAGALWVLLPQARHFHDDLARALTEYLRAPVAIARLMGRWDGIHPSVEIRGFALHHPDSGEQLLQFRRAEAVLDLPATLWQRRLVLRALVLQGGELALARTTDGWRLLPGDGVARTGKTLDPATVQALLLRMQNLTLELDSLQLLVGGGSPEPLVFENLRLALTVDDWERQLSLRVNPPGSRGPALRSWLTVSTDGNFQPREMRFFLRARNLPLRPYNPLASGLGGHLDLRLRGRWADTLDRLQGQLTIRDPRPPGSRDNPQLHRLLDELTTLRGLFEWRRQTAGWRGQLRLSGLGENAKPHWETTLDLHRPAAGAPLQGQLQRLPVNLLSALASPWLEPTLARRIARLEPSGYLAASRFSLTPDLDGFQVHGRFEDLSIRGSGDIPTVDGLDGSLHWHARGGELRLASHFLTVSGAPLAAPVELAVEGAVAVQQRADGLDLTVRALRLANADLDTTLNGTVDLRGTDTQLDLRLGVDHLALARLPRYLPVTRMKPKLVHWLRQALVAGRVRAGEGVLRGRLADFPFADGGGEFDLRLPVSRVVLDYAAEWPTLEAGRGEVRFRNREFSVVVDAGRLQDTELRRATARIETLGKPPMTVTTTLAGPGSSFLQAVQAGKVPAPVKRQLAQLEIDGTPEVTITVRFPFHQQPPVVSGRVRFAGSDVHLPRYRLPLQDVHGELHFGPEGLEADPLDLTLHGRPANLTIDSEPSDHGGRRTRFLLVGEPDPARLLLGGDNSLLTRLTGRSRWRVVVSVARAEHYRLELQSDLRGSRLRLPGPLAKAPGEARPLTLDLQVAPRRLDVSLAMAPGLRGRLRWSGNPARLERGELRLHAGEASLPAEPGVALIGRLSTLKLGDAGEAAGPLPTTLPAWFRSLDLAVQSLVLGDYRLPDLHLRLRRDSPTLLAGGIVGETAEGQLRLPLDRAEPLSANLRWLRLPAPAGASADPGTGAGGADPRQLPALHLSVERLELAGQSWGALELQARPGAGGLHLDPIVLGDRAQRLAGSGDWRRTPEGQLTRLQLNLQSRSLGDTLEKLGLDPQLSGAPASGLLNLAWTDSLLRPSLPRLSGQLDLDIGAGRFLSLEPGSLGRLLGLISLHGLGRRLSLDFSDVNAEGLGFDAIRGSVTLGNGVARSENLLLTSPAARVHLEGEVGLLARTLDQTVTVVPRIGTSLGLAGTLVGGPVVGAAVLAADTLLPGGVGQVTRLSYRITGSWRDPEVERLSAPPPPQRPTDPLSTITNR